MTHKVNSTSGLGLDKESKSVYEVLIGSENIKDCIQNSYMPFLDVLPANINLVGAEVELVSIEDRETQLREALKELNDYDYVFYRLSTFTRITYT